MEFFTIGVYNSSEEEFFNKLTINRIDTFCDIRQRRGVRGAKYAFVNSVRLQSRLNELSINYGHISELAPTKEIRDLQKMSDAANAESKRERQSLGKVFIDSYIDLVLNKFNFESFFEKLDQIDAHRVVLFCVEEQPAACHRSIVTNRLKEMGLRITHL